VTTEKLKVVVVDDDASVRLVVTRVLQLAGYEVKVFEGSADALAHSRSEKVDAMVIDQNLPEMSGLELVRRIRAERGHVPAVIITGLPDLRGLAKEKIEVFLGKPFKSLKSLEDGVVRAIELGKSQRAREELQQRLDKVVSQLHPPLKALN
jgi:FixJ family two-component response regulator